MDLTEEGEGGTTRGLVLGLPLGFFSGRSSDDTTAWLVGVALDLLPGLGLEGADLEVEAAKEEALDSEEEEVELDLTGLLELELAVPV